MSKLEKIDELKAENELLLLQLQQVQDELEYYFLSNQKLADVTLSGSCINETQRIHHSSRLVPSSVLLDKVSALYTGDHSDLSNASKNELADLRGELQSAYSDVKLLESSNKQLQQQLERQSSEYQTAVDALRGELSAVREENQQHPHRLNDRVKDLEQSESRALQGLNLAQKMQAKAQSDLDSLREKYKQKHENEQHLLDLIRQLKEKLQLASHYCQQLQEAHPDLLED